MQLKSYSKFFSVDGHLVLESLLSWQILVESTKLRLFFIFYSLCRDDSPGQTADVYLTCHFRVDDVRGPINPYSLVSLGLDNHMTLTLQAGLVKHQATFHIPAYSPALGATDTRTT